MRFLSVATAIGLLFAASILPANAQESVKELAAKASAELRLLTAFQTLERMTSQMNHFLVYAVEAERGGWDVIEFNNAPDGNSANAYMIRSTSEDIQLEIARANSSIMKSKVATEDELKDAEATMASLGVLVSLAPQIADMVAEGELDAAAVLYHETGQPAHENALRGAQSSVSTVQKRLGKTLLMIRVAK
ncbi:MAG: hypothetical protein KJN60_13975 [Boseongicola sp.]|nr:hypothetical protein [Boseongicola sp.]